MPFSVSTTVDGIAYSISAETCGELIGLLYETDGVGGFVAAVQEVHGEIAGRAVAPIAAPDQDGAGSAPEPQDELADLIRNAPDVKALTALWRAHKARWNADYNNLADKRKKELEKK